MATEQGSQGMPCGGRALASMATVRGPWQFGGVVYCSLISRQSLSPTMPPSRREHDLTTHLKWPISTKDVMQSNPFNKQNFNLTAATWLIFSACMARCHSAFCVAVGVAEVTIWYASCLLLAAWLCRSPAANEMSKCRASCGAGTLTAFIACFCSLQVPSKNPQHFILLLKTPEALEYVFLALLGHGWNKLKAAKGSKEIYLKKKQSS